MPNGKIHALMTVGGAAVLAGGLWLAGLPVEQAALYGGGTLAGLVLTPDLDVDGGCFAFYAVRWALGKPAAWVWRVFWWPYAKLVPHRSWASHSLAGTFIRLAYLCLPVRLALWAHGEPFWPPVVWWWLLSGLLWSDTLHILADMIVTSWKRRRGAMHV